MLRNTTRGAALWNVYLKTGRTQNETGLDGEILLKSSARCVDWKMRVSMCPSLPPRMGQQGCGRYLAETQNSRCRTNFRDCWAQLEATVRHRRSNAAMLWRTRSPRPAASCQPRGTTQIPDVLRIERGGSVQVSVLAPRVLVGKGRATFASIAVRPRDPTRRFQEHDATTDEHSP